MAEALDMRDWQAGVDADLVRRLQGPLRRSAAVGCAWAREALARGQLGELPMFASWARRWGMTEAALAELRPVVHAIAGEAAPGGEAPANVVVTARVAVAAGPGLVARTPVVSASRSTREVDATRREASHEVVSREVERREVERREVVSREVVSREVVSREAVSREAVSREVVSREVVQDAARSASVPVVPVVPTTGSIDLRVDPALLVPADATPPAAPASVAGRTASEPGLPVRPRTRPRLLTPMDLAREQAGAAFAAAVASPGELPASAGHELRAEVVASAGEPGPRRATLVTGVAGEVATPPIVAVIGDRSPLAPVRVEAPAVPVAADGEASPAIVHASPASTAATVAVAASTSASASTSPTAPPRVRARVLVGPVAPVVMEGPQPAAAARPRVRVPAPAATQEASLTGLAPARTDAPRMDLGLPAAVAGRVTPAVASAPAATPAPTPAPAQRPAPARVETSQLDIPAIAQAVHRHLERELRWERERRGGRP